MNLFDSVMFKIRQSIDRQFGGNVANAAKAWGIKNDNLHKWLRGDRSPSFELLAPILEQLGLGLSDAEPEDNSSFDEEYIYVPKVNAVAGAGISHLTEGRETGRYAFRKLFLEREHIHGKDSVLMMVSGDSMEPYIKEGDTILIDEKDNNLQDGKIFVVGLDDALMVKRMVKIPGGWKMCSDNKDRGDYILNNEELPRLRIYGRVRWFGRVLS